LSTKFIEVEERRRTEYFSYNCRFAQAVSLKSELFDNFMKYINEKFEIKKEDYPNNVMKSVQELDENVARTLDRLFKGEDKRVDQVGKDGLNKDYQMKLEVINNDLQRLINENFNNDSQTFNRNDSDSFKSDALNDPITSIEKQIRKLNELLKPQDNKQDTSCIYFLIQFLQNFQITQLPIQSSYLCI
jgi:hypothetical protein